MELAKITIRTRLAKANAFKRISKEAGNQEKALDLLLELYKNKK